MYHRVYVLVVVSNNPSRHYVVSPGGQDVKSRYVPTIDETTTHVRAGNASMLQGCDR